MTLLLDTHAFLWWIEDAPALSKRARGAIASAENEVLLSVGSCWELAIKTSLGRLRIKGSLDRFLPEQIALNGFRLLEVTLRHVARVAVLPFHHRDPFDRLLVAQALEDDLAIVSADRVFRAYGIRRVW